MYCFNFFKDTPYIYQNQDLIVVVSVTCLGRKASSICVHTAVKKTMSVNCMVTALVVCAEEPTFGTVECALPARADGILKAWNSFATHAAHQKETKPFLR
jgi:hypothetical protein